MSQIFTPFPWGHDRGPRFTQERDHKRATRTYYAYGFGLDDADILAADGVPSIGDTWSSAEPSLTVRSIEIQREGDQAYVIATYTDQLDTFTPNPTASKAFTRIGIQAGTVPIRYWIDVDDSDTLKPLPTDVNATIPSTVETIEVVAWSSSFPSSYGSWRANRSKTNDGTVSLPPLSGRPNTERLSFSTGVLLYLHSSVASVNNGELIQITHSFLGANDWKLRYSELTYSSSVLTVNKRARVIYEDFDFATLTGTDYLPP